MCCEHCSGGAHFIDAAIAEGRIDASARETYLRTFERSPELVLQTLSAAKPDSAIATRNFMAASSDEEQLAYRADAASRFGIPMAEVL